ncbi:MAG: hypothetical protein FWF95_05065 [Syntrophorhabdaceae bacterium]|nr:hypothetical protein [Syntrophorhabdaceae bacterium]
MKNKIFKKIEEIEGLLAIIILVALPCSFFSGYQVYMRLTHHGFEYYPVSSVKDLNDAFKKDYMFVEVNDGLLVKSNWVHIKKNLLFGFIPVTKTTTHYSFYFGSDNSRGWVLVKLSKEMKEAYIKNYSAKGRVSEYDSADKKIINHVRHGHFGNHMQTAIYRKSFLKQAKAI